MGNAWSCTELKSAPRSEFQVQEPIPFVVSCNRMS